MATIKGKQGSGLRVFSTSELRPLSFCSKLGVCALLAPRYPKMLIVSTLGQPSLILFKTYLPLSSGKPYKITFSKKGPSDPAAMSRLRLLGFPFQISCITSSYSRFFKGHSSFGQGGGVKVLDHPL